MTLKRYLLSFGYIGTYFRGVQKQHCKGVAVRPTETIQGLLEVCLGKLPIKPVNIPVVWPSSRTDSGVHALCSTAHTDLNFGCEIHPERITHGLNSILRKARINNVSIYETRQVPNTFSARHSATRRTYVYRFAVLKKTIDVSQYLKITSSPLPILEQDKCFFILDPEIDINLIKRTCTKFIGTKDFRSFMGSNKEPEDLLTERTIYNLELKSGRPLYPCPLSDNFDFYEIECTGRSFLYKQVRRMVGCILAVGLKKLSVPEIDYLLDVPAKDSWNPLVEVLPPHGLFLARVWYIDSDMILTDDNQVVEKYESQADDLGEECDDENEDQSVRKC